VWWFTYWRGRYDSGRRYVMTIFFSF
jgi:hypothetical protein